ncbi:MAG TPA: FAD-dependent monooxygenase [Streptosporangiaceae bacterium]|nr:FAD-dependent monooxygenase [Streptosporangiaceae bacterium]
MEPGPHAVVVGGSLSGLCAGLALAREGWTTTIVERATGEPAGGAGLGLDRGLLGRVTGVDAARIPVVSGNRDSAAWGLVRQFLLEAAQRAPGIEFIESTTVTAVREPGEAGRVSADSTRGALTADVAVGADGVYSVLRRYVAPDRPAAGYAGYMLWRGLVPESEVPDGLDGRGGNLEIHAAPGAQLVIYGVPGADGRTGPGERRISFAWYDASRTELLRQTGCVDGDAVVGTLANDQIPGAVLRELGQLARRYWPSPWDRCIGWGVSHGEVFGAPVAEYLPSRLVRHRVALIGDAAHVASPMTGAGFENALLDVAALAASLSGASGAGVPAALGRYEQERLPLARQLVSSGMSWGRSYLSAS